MLGDTIPQGCCLFPPWPLFGPFLEFLQHPNELLTHDRIYDFVWDYDEEYSDNSLRTYIKNLRKILGKDTIVSLKKLGYRFNQE